MPSPKQQVPRLLLMADELPGYAPPVASVAAATANPALPRVTANYPARPFSAQHVIKYNLSGKDTCTLKFPSRAKGPTAGPVFLQGDSIAGSFELQITKAVTLKSVELKVVSLLVLESLEVNLDLLVHRVHSNDSLCGHAI